MYGPGEQRPADPGGREGWLRRLAAACLAAAVLVGTLAFTFAPGRSSLPDQGSQPGPPANLEATPDGSSEVTLSWDPPTSDGGAGIIFYDVFEGTSFLREVPASDTSYTVAVTSGTTYTFQVSATNDDKQQGPAATVTYPASSQTTSSQAITFGPLASQLVNARFTVSATATSGLAVTFSSGTPAVCTVSDSTVFDQADVMTVAAGVCTIVAAQGGNADWAAATSVQQSFRVIPGRPILTSQAITFGPLASRLVNARFTVSATATSGLAVTFSSGTPAVCTVSGATVTTVAVGTCTIVAAQDGNADYALASDVTRSFRVGSVTSAGGLPLLIIVAAAVILAAAAAALAARRRRLRSRPWPAPELDVRAVPHAGPPVVARVQATGTGATHTVRIEPHPGTGITTVEESRP
jgi:Fibronectin type III domain